MVIITGVSPKENEGIYMISTASDCHGQFNEKSIVSFKAFPRYHCQRLVRTCLSV